MASDVLCILLNKCILERETSFGMQYSIALYEGNLLDSQHL